jgi:hypothetical protein
VLVPAISRLNPLLFSVKSLYIKKVTIPHVQRAKFAFEGSFGMSLEGDCYELEITSKLLVTFSKNLEPVCHELDTKFYYKPISVVEDASYDQKFLKKLPPN